MSIFNNVFFNNVLGSTWKTGNGRRQESILSSLLFNLYVNEIITKISELNVGCSLKFYKTSILCYADDIKLTAPSAVNTMPAVYFSNVFLRKL